MNALASRRSMVAVAGLLALVTGLVPRPARAQNVPSQPEREKHLARTAPAGRQQLNLICQLNRPSQVDRFFLVCTPGTTQIEVSIADCCIPGDHWQVKAKAWDAEPNTAVQTAPPNNLFSPPAQVLNYGGTSHNHDLEALIECSYLNGVDVWPAGSFITVTSVGGTCTSTSLGLEDRIDRAP